MLTAYLCFTLSRRHWGGGINLTNMSRPTLQASAENTYNFYLKLEISMENCWSPTSFFLILNLLPVYSNHITAQQGQSKIKILRNVCLMRCRCSGKTAALCAKTLNFTEQEQYALNRAAIYRHDVKFLRQGWMPQYQERITFNCPLFLPSFAAYL